jgi:hypothetical protein
MPSAFKPWFAIATPHEDIREGRLSEAVFAANLWAVRQETAPEQDIGFDLSAEYKLALEMDERKQ